MSKLITINELQEMLKVSRATIYNYINKGLPVTKVGRLTRFKIDDVIEWIDKQNGK